MDSGKLSGKFLLLARIVCFVAAICTHAQLGAVGAARCPDAPEGMLDAGVNFTWAVGTCPEGFQELCENGTTSDSTTSSPTTTTDSAADTTSSTASGTSTSTSTAGTPESSESPEPATASSSSGTTESGGGGRTPRQVFCARCHDRSLYLYNSTDSSNSTDGGNSTDVGDTLYMCRPCPEHCLKCGSTGECQVSLWAVVGGAVGGSVALIVIIIVVTVICVRRGKCCCQRRQRDSTRAFPSLEAGGGSCGGGCEGKEPGTVGEPATRKRKGRYTPMPAPQPRVSEDAEVSALPLAPPPPGPSKLSAKKRLSVTIQKLRSRRSSRREQKEEKGGAAEKPEEDGGKDGGYIRMHSIKPSALPTSTALTAAASPAMESIYENEDTLAKSGVPMEEIYENQEQEIYENQGVGEDFQEIYENQALEEDSQEIYENQDVQPAAGGDVGGEETYYNVEGEDYVNPTDRGSRRPR